ncbi:MAG: restriction endonuclease [Solirubrobacterales bacterium]|nr:restriction endonuclease [Solirubrobacterales bacterium]
MAISRDTLRGYVLEELLAKLIQNTGYRLLADASQDPGVLEDRPNGLAVRGRGGLHQVDVLGELLWIPAFTFPIRLFVEAKARGRKCGIDDVRNALGVVSDVNQHVERTPGARRALVPRFTYRYALFSTSGFSAPAAEYALAHQISLVDLSAVEFRDIVRLADDITDTFYADRAGPSRARRFVSQLRACLRIALGTWPDGVPLPANGIGAAWNDVEGILRERIGPMGELFVGMANGPYLLLLRAGNPMLVIEALDSDPVQQVSIHWSPSVANGQRWTVTLDERPGQPELTFALPAAVAEWIFDPDTDSRRRAVQFKRQFLSTITIYRHVGGRDRLYRLQYSPDEAAESLSRARG